MEKDEASNPFAVRPLGAHREVFEVDAITDPIQQQDRPNSTSLNPAQQPPNQTPKS